jgi:hypothetical protein
MSSLSQIREIRSRWQMDTKYAYAPADENRDEATQAVQTALDRRDNGGNSSK